MKEKGQTAIIFCGVISSRRVNPSNMVNHVLQYVMSEIIRDVRAIRNTYIMDEEYSLSHHLLNTLYICTQFLSCAGELT